MCGERAREWVGRWADARTHTHMHTHEHTKKRKAAIRINFILHA